MSDSLQMSDLRGGYEECVLACNRLDPWACCDLYSVRCRLSGAVDSGETVKAKRVSKKETKSVEKGGMLVAAKKKAKGKKPKKQMGPVVTGKKKKC